MDLGAQCQIMSDVAAANQTAFRPWRGWTRTLFVFQGISTDHEKAAVQTCVLSSRQADTKKSGLATVLLYDNNKWNYSRFITRFEIQVGRQLQYIRCPALFDQTLVAQTEIWPIDAASLLDPSVQRKYMSAINLIQRRQRYDFNGGFGAVDGIWHCMAYMQLEWPSKPLAYLHIKVTLKCPSYLWVVCQECGLITYNLYDYNLSNDCILSIYLSIYPSTLAYYMKIFICTYI